jgi:O-acetyl-ADP-ribose deacetylase (regulator of RNase III)
MLQHDTGNLIDMAEQNMFDIIIHGCNCMHTMGSGIAKEVRERYPQAYDEDLKTVRDARNKVGTYSVADAFDEDNNYVFSIINAYTQFNFSPRGVDHFEYEGFENILNELFDNDSNVDTRFGFPYVGCGLAGGNEERIVKIIENFANKVTERANKHNGEGSVTLVKFG